MENPKIRFKGFTKDWEQRRFGEITELKSASRVHKDEWTSNGVPFYRSSDVMTAINGTENEKAFISEELYEKLSKVSGKLEEGDILVTGGGSVGNPYIVPDNKPLYTKDADLLWIKNKGKFHPYFLYEFFFSPTFRNYLGSISHVGTIAHYTITQLSDTPIGLPIFEEQKEVGEYFQSLDRLITLHQRKCEQTKKLKKYMLQKMFPRNGAKVPEIRFDGFTYDWEQRKLNEVAEKICVGFVGTCEKFYTDESGIPMYRTGNLNGLSLNRDDLKYVTNEFHQHNQKSQLKAGDILIARHGDSGKAVNYENSEEANCLNIVIIRPDFKKCNYKFLTNCINSPECQKHIKSLSAGSTQAVINTSEIEKLGVVIPANIDEQNRIARYFSTLDNLITLHQRKCDELKKMKKYMLQNMFI